MTDNGATPWRPATEPVGLGQPDDYVMLVEGQSFCITTRSGDITAHGAQGLFVGDLRVLSRLELFVDGEQIEPLLAHRPEASSALLVGRTRPRAGRASLVVLRRRSVGFGMTEEIELRNYSPQRRPVRVSLTVDADFADLFAVKEGRPDQRGRVLVEATEQALRLIWAFGELERTVAVIAEDADVVVTPRGLVWSVEVPAHGVWRGHVEVALWVGGRRLPGIDSHHAPSGEPAGAARVRAEHETLERTLQRSLDDLDALRLEDPDGGPPVVAAGAPWFMTLFGRDALLTSWMALPFDPSLARGVLAALAAGQGARFDSASEEQPGRILHEVRFGDAASLGLRGGRAYFGTADATPLFVVLAGEAVRWGALGGDELVRLLPAIDAALGWIAGPGDPDGDGYVEYHCPTGMGLRNQGWKDSWDGVRFASGEVAEPPIALCEVQAYVYAAYLARARIADVLGEGRIADAWRQRADGLAERFNRDFWLEERGTYAIGLDADKRRIDSTTSNPGHALWSGIVPPERAASVAASLLAPAMWSGWGIRTLSSEDGGYDPISYHCGSVWPHDNALAVVGMTSYGLVEPAGQVARALVEAASFQDHRLPELFAGLSRAEVPAPVGYPTSCSPQAWAAAAPLAMLTALLGLRPDVPAGRLEVAPALPAEWGGVELRGLHLGGEIFELSARGSELDVRGLASDIEVVRRPA